MNGLRSIGSAGVAGLHPDRRRLILAAALSALLVQAAIAVVAHLNAVEVTLFAIALILTAIEPIGVGAATLTAITVLGWVWTGTHRVDGATLLVALALLVTHSCSTLAAHGHPQRPVEPTVAARWGRRLVLVGALTGVTWGAALIWRTGRLSPTAVLTVVALVLLIGALLWLRRELTRADHGE